MARRRFDFTPRSILCAVDFSAQSATALRHAAELAQRLKGRVTVLFVTETLFIPAAPADERALVRTTRRELGTFVRRSLSPGRATRVRYLIARGTPWREILKAAQRLRSTLVVVGTEGLGGTGSLFFGSTTEMLLRRAKIPVLAVPGTRTGRAKTPARGWPGKWLVAPNHLGRAAETEARRAAAVARTLGVGLILVHVIPTIRIPSWSNADLAKHYRSATAIAREWLDDLRSTSNAGVATLAHVEVGNPADVIAALARARQSGLVVLALRRTGALSLAGPDAIASRVLSQAVVPVLVLPPRQPGRLTAGR